MENNDAASNGCQCPDDRCAGFHHEIGEPCPCPSQPYVGKPLPGFECPPWCRVVGHDFEAISPGEWVYCRETGAASTTLSGGCEVTLYIVGDLVIRQDGRELVVAQRGPFVRFEESLSGVNLSADDCDGLATFFDEAGKMLREVGSRW